MGQTLSAGQQCYPSDSLRRNGDRDPTGPPGNGGHYLHRSGGGCGGPDGDPDGGDGCLPDNPYWADLDSSSSSEFER